MHIDWAVVFATLVGPILAVWASEWRQQRRADRQRKEAIFATLLATRSTPLHPDHVAAINRIDLAFPREKFPTVSDAWSLYSAQLNAAMPATAEGMSRWNETARDLLADLVHLMAVELKIPFSKSQVKQPSYYPSGHAFTESQHNELRALLLQVLRGERAVPIRPLPERPNDPPNPI